MKKWMKALFVFLLVPVMLVSCTVPASADVIWVPEDDFYEAHWEECYYVVNRTYNLAGQDGSVDFWSAPGGTVLKKLPNDEEFFASYCWPGETEDWVCVTIRGETVEEEVTGWVRAADMTLLYDSLEFFKDHAEEIDQDSKFSVQFDALKLFPYPNGPEKDASVHDDWEEELPFSATYTDEAGLQWGYISYWHGYREQWVCLDEPMIKGAAERKYVLTPEQERAAAQSRQTTLILAAVLVAAVVIVTVVLIRKLPKRKEAQQPENEDTQGDV